MIKINNSPVTIFTYFCILELGKSMSTIVASKINKIIFVIHSAIKLSVLTSKTSVI